MVTTGLTPMVVGSIQVHGLLLTVRVIGGDAGLLNERPRHVIALLKLLGRRPHRLRDLKTPPLPELLEALQSPVEDPRPLGLDPLLDLRVGPARSLGKATTFTRLKRPLLASLILGRSFIAQQIFALGVTVNASLNFLSTSISSPEMMALRM
jgi:hypothetical protein